jgi:hypothetical protein
MSDYTTTPNLGLYLPVPGEDDDVWGDHLNYNTTTLDTALAGGPFLPVASAPTPRDKARLQAQWQNAATVSDDTVWLCFDTPYAGTVNSLTYFTGNGSFVVSIQINGTPVTGLGAVAVSSATPATTSATAANVFTAGQRITAVITGSTGAPTDALLSLAVTWS